MCADPSSGRPAVRRSAFGNAQRTKISEYEIRLITAPYFLATKREAFRGRGKSDSAATTWERS
jgi:hypothetical protein